MSDELTAGRTNYLNADYGVRSWLLTVDHKRIALLYLMSITVMFVIGGLFAAVIRLELLTPQADIVGSDTYNKLFTMHGIIMVFFFLVPSIPTMSACGVSSSSRITAANNPPITNMTVIDMR